MISRINFIRRLLIPVSLLILLAFQVLSSGAGITTGEFLFFFAGDLFFLVVTYAFRGFEAETLKSRPASLYSYFVGSLVTLIVAVPVTLLTGFSVSLIPCVSTLALSFGLLPLFCSWVFRRSVSKLPPMRCLILGRKGETEPLLREVASRLMGRMEIVEYLNPSSAVLAEKISPASDGPAPDTIVIADPALAADVLPLLAKPEYKRIGVQFLPDLVEGTLKRIPIALLERFSDHYEEAFSTKKPTFMKRAFDLCFSVIFLTLSLPLSLFIAVSIPVTSGFPIIYRQPRIGAGMKPFMFYKFRSLRNAKPDDERFRDNPNAAIEQRVTGLGKAMRKLRLDEIPQFMNVLLNDMSVIGPRPEMETYHEKALQNIPWYDKRYLFKPGITGWAQISYKHTSSIEDYQRKTEYDLYYIKNWSLKLDFEIALKTVQTMLGMKGAV